MAAYGGAEAAAALGNQIFVSLRRGKGHEIKVVDVRVKYEETIADLRRKVEEAAGVPVESQQLFWGRRELTAQYDGRTLLELSLHTGFSLRGYDLREPPHYWPPVKKTDSGLVMLGPDEEGGHTEGYIH